MEDLDVVATRKTGRSDQCSAAMKTEVQPLKCEVLKTFHKELMKPYLVGYYEQLKLRVSPCDQWRSTIALSWSDTCKFRPKKSAAT